MSTTTILPDLPLKDEFIFPTNAQIGATALSEDEQSQPCTYLCGNSLGLLSQRSKCLVIEELDVWGNRGVEGHWSHPHGRNWKDIANHTHAGLAALVGAKSSEVACMGTLTANLHLMMNTFYKPTSSRFKILCEAHAFPSDQYAFASQVSAHGFDPAVAVIEVHPKPGEYTLRESDILSVIEQEGDSIALVLFSGVQYYTGQYFPIQSVTAAAQSKGAIVGWDLAHAIGNVSLELHGWGVDFAVWCSYKYLNSGPGGIAGLFVHNKWDNLRQTSMAGWWGNDPTTRFQMLPKFNPIIGAQGFQQSNPSVLSTASLIGSLQVFDAAGGIGRLRDHSIQLTAHLERILKSSRYYIKVSDSFEDDFGFTIITPSDGESRGAQLSLLFVPKGTGLMQRVFSRMQERGVIGDERRPDVIRLTPTPLYNTFTDCERAAEILDLALSLEGEASIYNNPT